MLPKVYQLKTGWQGFPQGAPQGVVMEVCCAERPRLDWVGKTRGKPYFPKLEGKPENLGNKGVVWDKYHLWYLILYDVLCIE